jgi:hypothetical protein
MVNEFQGKRVVSTTGSERGVATGSTYRCRMEGCNGMRVATKWEDGKTTHPCSKGMVFLTDGSMQIR